MSDRNEEKSLEGGISRRNFLGAGSAALVGVALTASALAQSPQNVRRGEHDHSLNLDAGKIRKIPAAKQEALGG